MAELAAEAEARAERIGVELLSFAAEVSARQMAGTAFGLVCLETFQTRHLFRLSCR